MEDSVKTFFTKNADQGYIDQYDKDHGPRLDNLIERFDLINRYREKSVVDIGGGMGFLGKRLTNGKELDYWILDGAEFPAEKIICDGAKFLGNIDLDNEKFSEAKIDGVKSYNTDKLMVVEERFKLTQEFDAAFCLETLEHLTNPYNCLAEIKKIVKENGEIYISIPHANVWHNYIYPALMIDRSNFEQFLGQMALPVIEYHLWDKGWNAHTWRCRNAPWTEAKMLYPKQESKFYGKTPVEYVNL
jgi:2-polyprenyl-3-methyl-5-hydroxy-6-metoxy-1,4-benzoquinol methylase